MMMMATLLATLGLFAYSALCQEPNPPTWPDNIYVFEEGQDSDVQSAVDKIFSLNGGTSPPDNGQWSSQRFAFLFKPGTYDVSVNLGYYTAAIGLGSSPSDTLITNVLCPNGDSDDTIGALNNFWRSAENFMTTPNLTQNGHNNTMMWAVSQGVSLRRVIVNGSLDLFQGAGYASGGYLSDVEVAGDINSGPQQQWYSRNAAFSQWGGGQWNMFYQGIKNPPSSQCGSNQSNFYSVPSTPIIAEKPFISFDLAQNKYFLNIPQLEVDKVGPTDFTNPSHVIDQIDFSNVYVAVQGVDTADTINAKLASGKHLILTAGDYNLTSSIQIKRSNTTVLGVGYPILMAMNGDAVIEVDDGLTDIKIAGVLLQAGPKNSSSLLRFGTDKTKSAQSSNSYNFLYDIWARVGGPNDPQTQQYMADVIVQINQNNVVLDNCWLWRADHDVNGDNISFLPTNE